MDDQENSMKQSAISYQLRKNPILKYIRLLVLASFFGCAGGSVTKIETGAEIPPDLATDLKSKFEVREIKEVATQRIPSPTPLPTQKKIRQDHKKQIPKPTQIKEGASPSPTPFAYPVRIDPRDPTKSPTWLSESEVFEISYFGVVAGILTLDVLPFKTIAERKVYHTKITAISSKIFSLFYRVNDTIESFFDYEGLFSHRFHVVLDETKQYRDALELNDSQKEQTYYWNRWNHRDRGYTESKDYQPIPAFPQDSLSSFFYLRSLRLATGDFITFPVVSEGKYWYAEVTVLRREEMDTPLGRKTCIVLKPETRYQGMLQKRGDSFVWLTDDDRRFLVRMEAKVRVGTLVAKLTDVKLGTPPAP